MLLLVSMFVMGICGIVYEYLLGTLASYVLGNSIQQMSITIGVMMFGMGFGSWTSRMIRAENMFDKFIALEICLGVIGGTSAQLSYLAFGYTDFFVPLLYTFCVVVGICIGLEIPILTRIHRSYRGELRINLSGVLSMDYLGSLIGALVYSFVLLKSFTIVQNGFLLGLTNVCVGLVGLAYFRRYVRYKKVLAAFGLVAAIGLGVGLDRGADWTRYLEQQLYEDRIVYSGTTRYQHLTVTKWRDAIYFYINGSLQFCSLDEARYHELLVHPAMLLAAERRQVLILGGGDGLAAREVLKYPEVERITLVDLDPGVTTFAATDSDMVRLNRGALLNARVMTHTSPGASPSGEYRTLLPGTEASTDEPYASVEIVNIDADRFIDASEGFFDIVLIDFPDPNGVELTKLYSAEFYRVLRHRVRRNGLVAMQATSPYHSKEAFLCILRTFRAAGWNALPYHTNVPSLGDWGWILGWASPVDEETMRARWRSIHEIGVPTSYLTPDVMAAALAFGAGALQTAETRINTKMDPYLLQYYIGGWQQE